MKQIKNLSVLSAVCAVSLCTTSTASAQSYQIRTEGNGISSVVTEFTEVRGGHEATLTAGVGGVSYTPSESLTRDVMKLAQVGTPSTKNYPVEVFLNGSYVSLGDPVLNGMDRTFLPVREIGDTLGATVNWDTNLKVATVEKDGVFIELPVNYNNSVVTKGGEEKVLEIDMGSPNVCTFVKNGRTYLPVRFVSEHLGAKVKFFENNGRPEIHLTTGGGAEPTSPKNPYVKPVQKPQEPTYNGGGYSKEMIDSLAEIGVTYNPNGDKGNVGNSVEKSIEKYKVTHPDWIDKNGNLDGDKAGAWYDAHYINMKDSRGLIVRTVEIPEGMSRAEALKRLAEGDKSFKLASGKW